MTTDEVAEYLRLQPVYVRRLVREKKLGCNRYSNRRIRFTRDDVLQYLERTKVPAEPKKVAPSTVDAIKSKLTTNRNGPTQNKIETEHLLNWLKKT